jgi:Bacterial regulatory proteins, tetR family
MSATETQRSALARRPKRADARRNYDKLIATGREAFTERDSSASLEDIARRAGVGIGTLYGAGEPLLRRAQEAGAVRPDVSIDDVVRMVGGIAKIQATDPATVERILTVAFDGLRYRAG